MNKTALRKKYLNERLELSKETLDQLNEQLCNVLFQSIDFSTTTYLHIFLPIEKFNEVNTWTIIDRIRSNYPKTNIVVSKVIGNNLEHYLLDSETELVKDKWGIPEPANGEVIRPNQIDTVLIPLVVADHQGNRIGYGKGYYDRFLTDCKPQAQKIGLSLLPLSVEAIDSEATDIKLDGCITPDGFVRFE